MSAMHWEARRRQHALDRRLAQDKKQLVHGDSGDTICSATEANTTQEQTAVALCPHCKAEMKIFIQHGAKIPSRYSSLQYTQQW